MAPRISGPTTERWFYNTATGLTIHGTIGANPTAWFDAVNGHLAGWHQYDTRAQMEADIKAHPGWAQSVGGVTGEIGNIAKSGLPAGPNIAGLSAIGDFFNRLTQPNTWIRVGEAAAGVLLIWIGLSAITRGTAAEAPIKETKKAISKGASLTPPGRALRTEAAARRRLSEQRVYRRQRQLSKGRRK